MPCLVRLVFVAGLLFGAPRAVAQDPAGTPEPGPQTVVVQPGDTLYSLAERFGTTVDAIVAANDLADPSLIVAGQKLIIPPAGAEPEPVPAPPNRRVHPVRPGETLPSLAFRYRTTVWALRETNGLDKLGLLRPGQQLLIPPPAATLRGPRFPALSVRPATVVQGETLSITVGGNADLILHASLLDRPLDFISEGGRYWALAGVNALTPPGSYTLVLTATEVATGDLITMRDPITVTAGSFPTANIAVPAARQSLLDPQLSAAEREKVEAAFAGVSERRLWNAPFGYPLAGELRVTSPFGQRRSYSGGPVSSYHSGQDLGAPEGAPVYAPAAGMVVMAEPLQVRGQVVILDHGWGVFSAFWHLSRIDVAVGQAVSRGNVVGLVGDTGLSTGPHLHWEMRVRRVPVDPVQWTRQEFP